MLEYTRKINRGYQLTLPQTFRDTCHLQIGDYVRIKEEGGKLIIEPVSITSKDPLQALGALFSSATDAFSGLSEDEIMKLVRKEIKKSRQEAKDEATRSKAQ